MDDLRTPVLTINSPNEIKPLRTIYLVYFLIALLLIVEFGTLACLFQWTSSNVTCDLFFLLTYTEVSFWLVNFIIRLYIKSKHKHILIANNFFDIHHESIQFIEIPFYISCLWLGILVVLLSLYAEYDVPHDFYCAPSTFYSPIVAVTIVITVQNLFIIPLFVIYTIKITAFNENGRMLQHENSNLALFNPLQHSFTSPEIGYRERGEVLDIHLEKQADLIRYYKDANEMLHKKIFQLTAQGLTASET